MNKNTIEKTSFLFLLIALTALLFSSSLFIPGLTQAEPVNAFLNDNFPDIETDNGPYGPAFPNITFVALFETQIIKLKTCL